MHAKIMAPLVGLLLFSVLSPANARTLHVGPGAEFTTIAAAAQRARDGDTVEIEAGRYPGDVAVWRANGVTIRGVGGRPHVSADGRDADGKGIWVVAGNDVVVENIELSGAKVADRNGAAVRIEGRNLTVRNCHFHHNENHLLGGIPDPQSTVLIEHSELGHSQVDGGLGHGIYLGRIGELRIVGSYLHHAAVGHNVKSRAARTVLLYNRIADESDGRSSYLVDAPNGGQLVMVGNVLQQGPQTENLHMVRFGEEGIAHARNEVLAANNTFVNLRLQGAIFVEEQGAERVALVNNIFWGRGSFVGRVGELSTNLRIDNQALIERHWPTRVFLDVQGLDFRLVPGSPAMDAAVAADPVDGVDLMPRLEYAHPASTRPRPVKGRLDMGAFEAE